MSYMVITSRPMLSLRCAYIYIRNIHIIIVLKNRFPPKRKNLRSATRI